LSFSLKPFSVLLRRGKRCTQWANLIHITALASFCTRYPSTPAMCAQHSQRCKSRTTICKYTDRSWWQPVSFNSREKYT
jgi:hypothetical protein